MMKERGKYACVFCKHRALFFNCLTHKSKPDDRKKNESKKSVDIAARPAFRGGGQQHPSVHIADAAHWAIAALFHNLRTGRA